MRLKRQPDFLFNEDITIKGHKTIDEDGNAIYEEFQGKCMSRTSFKRVFSDGKVNYVNETKIIINKILEFDCYGGKVYLGDKTLNIFSTYKDNDLYTVLICN